MVDYIRELGILFFGALTFLMFILCGDLLSRYYGADKFTRGDAAYQIFYILGVAMGGYGFYMVIAITNYFYSQEAIQALNADLLYQLQLFVAMAILAAITIKCEGLIFKKRRFLKFGQLKLGLYGSIAVLAMLYILGVMFIKAFLRTFYNEWVTWLTIPIILGFFVFGWISFLGILTVFSKLRPQKEIRRKIIYGILWAILAGIGSVIGGYGRMAWNYWFIIGTIVEIFGWYLLRTSFLSIPSYSELEWRSGLAELHVILAEVGLSLYNRTFRKINPADLKGEMKVELTISESDRPNTDLIGGGMIGIKSMLGEIAGTKGKLQNIQIGDKYLLFNQGKDVLVLLLANKNLGVYHGILSNIVNEIEATHPNLGQFAGNVEKLKIAPIIDNYFGKEE